MAGGGQGPSAAKVVTDARGGLPGPQIPRGRGLDFQRTEKRMQVLKQTGYLLV